MQTGRAYFVTEKISLVGKVFAGNNQYVARKQVTARLSRWTKTTRRRRTTSPQALILFCDSHEKQATMANTVADLPHLAADHDGGAY